MATKVAAKSGKNLEIIDRKITLMLFLKLHLIVIHPFLFVKSFLNILPFPMYVDMEIFIQFQYAFVRSIRLFHRSRSYIKLLTKGRLVIGLKLLAVIAEEGHRLRITQDRKGVGGGKSGSVREDRGGGGHIK